MQDKTLAELFTKARQFNLGALVGLSVPFSARRHSFRKFLANTSTKLMSGLEPEEASDIDQSLRTSQEFLLSLQKKDKGSEFACYVKGYTPHAVRLTIPFGVIEEAPKDEARKNTGQ